MSDIVAGIDWDKALTAEVMARHIPDELLKWILKSQKSARGMYEIDEMEFLKRVRMMGRDFSPLVNRIRIRFWNEYTDAMRDGRVMVVSKVYEGVCSKLALFHYFEDKAETVAWILCPPSAYQEVMVEALQYGLGQMREILELPNMEKGGKPNQSLMSLKVKIVQMLDERVHGQTVQRSIVAQIPGPSSLPHFPEGESMEELQRKLSVLDTGGAGVVVVDAQEKFVTNQIVKRRLAKAAEAEVVEEAE